MKSYSRWLAIKKGRVVNEIVADDKFIGTITKDYDVILEKNADIAWANIGTVYKDGKLLQPNKEEKSKEPVVKQNTKPTVNADTAPSAIIPNVNDFIQAYMEQLDGKPQLMRELLKQYVIAKRQNK